MARRSGRSWANQRGGYRTARVGELIRRIVAEALTRIDDDRLTMVSLTGVDVDRELHRSVLWFTTLDSDDDSDAAAAGALLEHSRRLRRAVSDEARLRRTPELVFRPDAVIRSAERIERLIAEGDACGG